MPYFPDSAFLNKIHSHLLQIWCCWLLLIVLISRSPCSLFHSLEIILACLFVYFSIMSLLLLTRTLLPMIEIHSITQCNVFTITSFYSPITLVFSILFVLQILSFWIPAPVLCTSFPMFLISFAIIHCYFLLFFEVLTFVNFHFSSLTLVCNFYHSIYSITGSLFFFCFPTHSFSNSHFSTTNSAIFSSPPCSNSTAYYFLALSYLSSLAIFSLLLQLLIPPLLIFISFLLMLLNFQLIDLVLEVEI